MASKFLDYTGLAYFSTLLKKYFATSEEVNNLNETTPKISASDSTVGGAAQPVYVNSGTVTASSSTVGSSTTPVYLNAGTLTACSNAYTSSDWLVIEIGNGVFMVYNTSISSGTTITYPFTLSAPIRAFATRAGATADAYYSAYPSTTSVTIYHSHSSSLSTNVFVFGVKA